MTIEVFGWTASQFEQMALEKIKKTLGYERKHFLKTFKVGDLVCTTPQEQALYREEMLKCYQVNGFLAFGEEKQGRAFNFLIEKGLQWSEAQDVADQLADQIGKCVQRMITDRRTGVTRSEQLVLA